MAGRGVPAVVAAPVYMNQHHSDYLCFKRLGKEQDEFCHFLKNIITINNNDTNLTILSSIKRCIYSRYADNFRLGRPNKIRTVQELVNNIFNYFTTIYTHAGNIDAAFIGGLNTGPLDFPMGNIFKAIDHFSIISSLKRLYLIIHYITNQPNMKIYDIDYYQNSSIRARNIEIYKNQSKKINYNITDLTGTNLEKKNKLLLTLYLSILRIFHSHNFYVSVKVNKANGDFLRNDVYDTQNDLFMRNQRHTNTIYFRDIINTSDFLQNINYQYKYDPRIKIPAKMNLKNNYHQYTNIVNPTEAIPFYLDIFSKTYYNNNNQINKMIQNNLRIAIKNNLIDSLYKYSDNDSLRKYGENNFRSIQNTLLVRLINENINNRLDETYIPDDLSLEIPESLYIKEYSYMDEEQKKHNYVQKLDKYQAIKNNVNIKITPNMNQELNNLTTKFKSFKNTYYRNENINNKPTINEIELRYKQAKRSKYDNKKEEFRRYLNNITKLTLNELDQNITTLETVKHTTNPIQYLIENETLASKNKEFSIFKDKYARNHNIGDNQTNIIGIQDKFSKLRHIQHLQDKIKQRNLLSKIGKLQQNLTVSNLPNTFQLTKKKCSEYFKQYLQRYGKKKKNEYFIDAIIDRLWTNFKGREITKEEFITYLNQFVK
jgi:hypothetical protein